MCFCTSFRIRDTDVPMFRTSEHRFKKGTMFRCPEHRDMMSQHREHCPCSRCSEHRAHRSHSDVPMFRTSEHRAHCFSDFAEQGMIMTTTMIMMTARAAAATVTATATTAIATAAAVMRLPHVFLHGQAKIKMSVLYQYFQWENGSSR